MIPDSAAKELGLEFDPDEPLQRLSDLTVQLQSDGSVYTEVGGRGILFGPHALRVLEVFTRPATFKQAMQVLRPTVQGAQDWVDLSDTIRNLYRAGALESTVQTSRVPSMRTGFDAPVEHISMLNDRARTEAYIQAIREVVRPDDVVVELGTGTGVLTVAAVKAGARHVYTIEAGGIGGIAKKVFEENGLSDRITLVSGLSTHVSLPERGDVLLSEIIGNEPLHERVLESTRDAITRFLKPEARFIPRMLRIHAVPVEIPESVVSQFHFVHSDQSQWGDWYDLDFSPLLRGNPPRAVQIFVRPHQPRDWPQSSKPMELAAIDFSSGHPPSIQSEAYGVAGRTANINGVVVYFDLELSPGRILSVDPRLVDERCSWRLPVWLLPNPLEVQVGERLKISYTYGAAGQNDRVSISRAPLGENPPPE
jgi:hypothetical protein